MNFKWRESQRGGAGGAYKLEAFPRAVERNSRWLTQFELLTDFPLDYGVHEFERGVSGRQPNNTSRRKRPAPMAIAESATLKARSPKAPNNTSQKSVTAPRTIRALTAPVSPTSKRART